MYFIHACVSLQNIDPMMIRGYKIYLKKALKITKQNIKAIQNLKNWFQN